MNFSGGRRRCSSLYYCFFSLSQRRPPLRLPSFSLALPSLRCGCEEPPQGMPLRRAQAASAPAAAAAAAAACLSLALLTSPAINAVDQPSLLVVDPLVSHVPLPLLSPRWPSSPLSPRERKSSSRLPSTPWRPPLWRQRPRLRTRRWPRATAEPLCRRCRRRRSMPGPLLPAFCPPLSMASWAPRLGSLLLMSLERFPSPQGRSRRCGLG